MGRRTHGPHLLAAIDANNHAKVHEILAVQVRNKNKIRETCTADVKRLASDNVDCPLILAAIIPDATIIRYLIAKQGVDVNFMHQRGTGQHLKKQTPLIAVVKRGLYLTMETLLELNANTNLQDHKGRTALHHAIFQTDYRMAKMLLTKGAQPNLTNKSENSALHVATKFGHLELVKLLMQYGGDLYKRGQYGAIPIHIAAKEGHVSLIEWFATHGSNINLKIPCYTEMREKTPLNVACEEGHIEAVLILVQKCKADVNIADSEGETPLHCTVLHEYDPFGMKSKDDYTDTALVLLKFGANCNMRNERGETALHHAARNEFQKVAELLVRAGTDPTITDHDRNKAIDLVSDDDAVTKNLLKRAVNDHDKLMSELLEIKARGFSTSMQSLNQLMLNNSMSSSGGPMSQSMMNIPNIACGLSSRTNSTPGLFMPDGSMIYNPDGYLQPFSTRPRMGSIGSIGAQSFAGMPLVRQDSIGSFHSVIATPMNTYCSIDSDGVVSESAAVGVVAPRLIRKKRGGEKRVSHKVARESSDSSQHDDMAATPMHSTPRHSASFDSIHFENQRKAKKPKAPFLIQPIGKQAGRKQKGEHGNKLQSSRTSLSSQTSTVSKSSSHRSQSSSIWDVTPFTSHSTLKADNDDTSEGNTSFRSTPDGSVRTLTDGEDGDIYENVACDEDVNRAIYGNIPDVRPSSEQHPIRPDLPPRTARRPLPPLPSPRDEMPNKPPLLVPPSPSASTHSVITTPFGKEDEQSNQEITIKISPHQSITIKTSSNGHTQAIQVNSLLPEDQPQGPEITGKSSTLNDSDDTFFDDDSFETISDLLESEGRRPKPIPPPKPMHLKRKKKPTPEQLNKFLEDPKLHDWLADQAVLLKERRPQGAGPIAHSTPPLSRRELENKLRQAFGKPPLSDSECSDNEPKKHTVTPVSPQQQQQQSSPSKQGRKASTDDEGTLQHQINTSPNRKQSEFVEYAVMNDLNAPNRAVVKPAPQGQRHEPTVVKTQTGAILSNPGSDSKQWEKMTAGADSNDTSIASLYWDHTEDMAPFKDTVEHKPNPPSHKEAVYMEMNGNASKLPKGAPLAKSRPNHEEFNQHIQKKLQEHQQDGKAVAQQCPVESDDADDADDNSFDSFDSESDDEGVPNSCHQVAHHFRLPQQNGMMSNLVLATPTGNIVPDARHSSTNAHSIMLPGTGEMMAQRMADKPPGSPVKPAKGPPKAKADIVVVRTGALVNGMPINHPSPGVLRRSNSIQDERNAQLVTAIQHSQVVRNSEQANCASTSISVNGHSSELTSRDSPARTRPPHVTVGSGSSQSTETTHESDSPTHRPRKVTMGSEEIKLISDEEKLAKDHDHRQIVFDTKNKMSISIIGGNSDGIFVHRIDPGSDAEQKGLMEGDQILEINGVNSLGRTKEEVTLQLMSLKGDVTFTVRHKMDRYNSIRLNGGMGDSFFVKAHFMHDSKQKGEMKIHVGDIFSIRDTLPSGRMGSWQALKVNARPNEVQHGLIPNESRAEQVALASQKASERGRGLEKENRGSFIRRSLRRSKSADRLHKETEAFSKSQMPLMETVQTYERVEQRTPGFLRPVIILGLFCDAIRDRLLQELPGLFEKPPPEVESPTMAEAGDSNKVPVDIRHIQDIIRANKHPLMIMSPRAIQYLVTTTLYPIVIYLTPGSKDIIKKLRSSLAPGFAKRSAYMYDESQLFARTYTHLFTATVTYTSDESWYALLKDTIKRIQNQPLWQPIHRDAPRSERDESLSPDAQSPSVNSENRLPRLATSARIPDPIRSALQRHANGGSATNIDTSGMSDPLRPREMSLTYDGYFLSETQERPASARPMQNGNAKSLENLEADSRPRSILKNRSPSVQALPMGNGNGILDKEPSSQKFQQIGLIVPVPQHEENNNGRTPVGNKSQMRTQQQISQQQQHVIQKQIVMQQQQQMKVAHHQQQQQAAAQQILIQQMFQQQFANQQFQQYNHDQQQLHYQQQQQQQVYHQAQQQKPKQPSMTRQRGLNHESIETDL